MENTSHTSGNISRIYSRLIFAFVVLSLFMVITFSMLFRLSVENVRSIGHLNAVKIAQDLQYYLIEEIDEITLAAHTVDVMLDLEKSNEEILDYLTFESRIVTETINENYTGIYGYINGRYMDGSGWIPEADYDPTTRPWYTGALEGNGKVVYITPYLDAETGSIMVSICKMLPDGKSVISLDILLDRIQGIVDTEFSADYDEIIVTDKNDVIVAAMDKSMLGVDITDDPMTRAYYSSDARTSAVSYFVFRDSMGNKYTVFSSAVENQWNVFLVKKSSKLMSSLYNIFAVLIIGSVAFITFLALVFDYMNKRRKAAEALNIQLESIADIYISVHKYDIEHDKLEEVRCMPYVREQLRISQKTASNSYETLEGVMMILVRSEYREDMKAFLDLNTLDLRMGSSSSISLEYMGVHGWAKARIVFLERKNNRISSFLWMLENIDEEKRKQSELRYLSETDLMTGVKNRGCGERLIKERLMNREKGMFCLMDADHFKSINDNYGHDVGDEIIKAIADCMKRTFRSNDIVLRLGGDEFAVFVAGIETEAQAAIILNRFLTTVDEIDIAAFGKKKTVEISIGVSFASADCEKRFDVLYKEADKAAYRSKTTIGSCISFFDAELDT